ncbi:MAG: dTDP-4-dehydrorhamnose reductase [Elusimicrobiales bacterium]|nr:dTDP-4-dehydrorhamnose reductase [Elusimicrobiales bacterium]
MKYLITGSDGQLAKEFIKVIPHQNIWAYNRLELDITNKEQLYDCIESIKPDIIINCAAYNNVDKAETDYENALKVNAIALKDIALISSKYKSKIIHFSTDYVFDGNKTEPYKENDIPNPLNKYALSKLEGEKLLAYNYDNFAIFRVSWVYGEGQQNFIYKFLSWAKDKKTISVSIDEISVPTSTSFIVENVLKAIDNDIKGIWHLVPLGYVSRYDWAEKIISLKGINIELKKAYQKDFNLSAKRPNFSALDSSALSRELSVSFENWDFYLEKFMKNYSLE